MCQGYNRTHHEVINLEIFTQDFIPCEIVLAGYLQE
jgi:hypothetical protein